MKYRKKPLEVDAFCWKGNFSELLKWIKASPLKGSYTFKQKKGWFGGNYLLIKTNKGSMKAKLNDWIIKGIKGEYYPVPPDIFVSTYEKINEA